MQAMVKKESMPNIIRNESKAAINQKDILYTDNSFPPNETSLITYWDDD